MMSRRQKDKNGTLVGEKSQAVYSANWKLDTILGKRLNMLDTSKRRVSHSITIDQRIVNKRFQMKLHQSKIYNARMTGNRELLRQLNHRDNFSFNTSVGQDDQYSVNLNRNAASAPAGGHRSRSSESQLNQLATDDEPTGECSNNVGPSDSFPSSKRVNALKALQRRMSARASMTSQVHKMSPTSESLKVPGSPEKLPVIECSEEELSEPYTPGNNNTPPNIKPPVKEDSSEIDHERTVAHILAKRRQRPVTSITRTISRAKSPEQIINAVADSNKQNKIGLRGGKRDRRPMSSTAPGLATTRGRSISSNSATDKPRLNIESPVSTHDGKAHINDSRKTENEIHSPVFQLKITPTPMDEKTIGESVPEITIQESSIKHLEQLENKTIQLKEDTTATLPTTSTLQAKRKSISINPKNKQVIPSIFGEQRKVTIFDVNQGRIETANLPCRFDDFFESLRGLENDQDYCVDYYTMRLQQTCDKNVSRHKYGETEEEQLFSMKSVGNVSARSMTFHDLNHDFSDYPSQYFLNPRSSSVARNSGSYSVKNAWDIADKPKQL